MNICQAFALLVNGIADLLECPMVLLARQLLKTITEAILWAVLFYVCTDIKLLVPEAIPIIGLAVQRPTDQHGKQYSRDSVEEPH